MKGFSRPHPELALCGLSCALCPMYIGGCCPGCGGGAGNQSCAIARCGLDHGGVEFCCDCGAYPCKRLADAMAYDSFVPHQSMLRDLDRVRERGPEACRAELSEKAAILRRLLERYNDGRRKRFFCTAAALLDLEALRLAMADLAS